MSSSLEMHNLLASAIRRTLGPKKSFPELGDAVAVAPGSSEERFPIVVNSETKAYLAARAVDLKSSLASVAGLILDDCAAQSASGSSTSLQSVADRLHALIRAHRISEVSAAAIFKRWNIGIGPTELADDSALFACLTPENLWAAANLFRVRYDWLVGLNQDVVNVDVYWYKAVWRACERVLEALAQPKCHEVELAFVFGPGAPIEGAPKRTERSGQPDPDTLIPVLRCSCSSKGNPETLYVHEAFESIPWNYPKAQSAARRLFAWAHWLQDYQPEPATGLGVGARLRMVGYFLGQAAFGQLHSRQVLPAALLQPHQHIDWFPEDYAGKTDAKDLEQLQKGTAGHAAFQWRPPDS